MFNHQKLFHFVFANQDDEYYTSSLLRLTLEGYLWRKLIDKQYRSVIIREKGIVSSDYCVQLTGLTSQDFRPQQKAKAKKSLLKRWLNDEDEYDGKKQSSLREQVKVGKNKILEYMDKTIDMMGDKEETALKGSLALVVPIRLLQQYCAGDDGRKNKLKKLINKNNGNIIVVVSTVFAEDNDPYFISPLWRREKKGEKTDSVFTEKEFYRELYDVLAPGNDKPRMMMVYDRMKNVMEDQVLFLNRITLSAVSDVLRYQYIRKGLPRNGVSTEMAAVIIYLWFRNAVFYEKYQYTRLMSPNIGRSFRVMADDIRRVGFEAALAEIVEQEQIDDPKQLEHKWGVTEEGVYVPFSKNSTSEMPMAAEMKRYRTILLRKEGFVKEKRLANLSGAISYFEKPGYVSKEITGTPSFLNIGKKQGTASRKTVEGALKYLENREEWNKWDQQAAKMIYVLFRYCRAEAEEDCCKDYQCRIGQKRFEKIMEAVNCCFSFSEKAPNRLDQLDKISRSLDEALKKGDIGMLDALVFPVI